MNPLEAARATLVSFQNLHEALLAPRDWPTRRGLATAKADLRFHRNKFKENVENLLGQLLDDDGEAARLCQNPTGEKWEDSEMDVTLRRVHATSYEPIQDNLEAMSALLEDIQAGLEEIEVLPNSDYPLPNNLVS